MNGINRRGQKVQCMMIIEVGRRDGSTLDAPVPQCLETYTVEDFLLAGRIVEVDDLSVIGEVGPGISLVELPCVVCECCGRTTGWPIAAFRPLVEDESKTDISALVEAAKQVPAPTPGDEIRRAFERVTGSPLPERVE